MNKSIVDENGVRIEIPMSAAEIKEWQKLCADYTKEENIKLEKEKNRNSALAKLAGLGLTEDEIAAL